MVLDHTETILETLVWITGKHYAVYKVLNRDFDFEIVLTLKVDRVAKSCTDGITF